ncbi:hypothetical protein JHK85_007820 [Glycine max]|nr:hypothetical protein JHK85_007820 [Glycine max]
MAPRRIEMLLSMSLVMVLWGVTLAQSDQSSSCTNVFISLAPCLDYVTGNASIPSSSCCSQLAFVVRSQPLCLCEVVNGGASSIAASFNINQTRALALPTACNVQTPPITSCSGIGSSTVSSTIGGSRSVGASYHGNSSSTKLPCSLLVIMFFLATTLTFTFKTMT